MSQCVDPNCHVCKIQREKEAMACAHECTRCGSVHSSGYHFCEACAKIRDTEFKSQFKAAEVLKAKLDNSESAAKAAEHNLVDANRELASTQSSYMEASRRLLDEKVHSDHMKMVMSTYEAIYTHMKASKACPACSTGSTCKVISLLEEQMNSKSSVFICEECKSKDAMISVIAEGRAIYYKMRDHAVSCADCSSRTPCSEYADLRVTHLGTLQKGSSCDPTNNSSTSLAIRRSKSMLGDFSHMGEGAGVIFFNGEYRFVTLDLRLITSEQMKLLSSGGNPKEALVRAERLREAEADIVHSGGLTKSKNQED